MYREVADMRGTLAKGQRLEGTNWRVRALYLSGGGERELVSGVVPVGPGASLTVSESQDRDKCFYRMGRPNTMDDNIADRGR